MRFYAVCLALVALGALTATSRPNFLIGVRTPWTVSSAYSWSVTNRLAGGLTVLTGLAGAAVGALSNPPDGYWTIAGGIIAGAVISTVVSYFAWRADPERRSIERRRR
jgi:uncharacterized membrane protein